MSLGLRIVLGMASDNPLRIPRLASHKPVFWIASGLPGIGEFKRSVTGNGQRTSQAGLS
jgi:hypothetical protein